VDAYVWPKTTGILMSLWHCNYKAFTIETSMAHKHKNLGKQVRTTYHDWSDDTEPVLPTPTVHEDSYERNPWADCICPAVYSDEPVEPMESSARECWKISPSRVLWLGICLLYLCWCRRPSLYSCRKM
jgi:hypothetical protein